VSSVDTELVGDLRRGLPGAWERLIDRYASLALSVPLRLGLSQADAEEVCQATWVILHRHLLLIEKPGSLSAWILTTASREAAKIRRARAQFRQLEPELNRQRMDESPSPREELDRFERIQQVRELVAQMAGPNRRLLTKLYFDPREPSYAQIAKELDIPIGSIGPMRGRCLASLGRKLTKHSSLPVTGRSRLALDRESVV
jgi:RNA polymerase sigma factor (sigma-70 family)